MAHDPLAQPCQPLKVRVAGLLVCPLALGIQGQRLVRSMASQIGGMLEIKPDAGEPGTVATVRFPVAT